MCREGDPAQNTLDIFEVKPDDVAKALLAGEVRIWVERAISQGLLAAGFALDCGTRGSHLEPFQYGRDGSMRVFTGVIGRACSVVERDGCVEKRVSHGAKRGDRQYILGLRLMNVPEDPYQTVPRTPNSWESRIDRGLWRRTTARGETGYQCVAPLTSVCKCIAQ